MNIVSKRTFPNILSVARLLSVPLLVFLLIVEQGVWALFVMVIFTISDLLDGYLARLWAVTSEFGAILDPIADKFFIASLVTVLAFHGYVHSWLVGLILGRDFIIFMGLGCLNLLNKFPEIKPTFLSKINTTCQLVYLGFVLTCFAFPSFQGLPCFEPLPHFIVKDQTVIGHFLRRFIRAYQLHSFIKINKTRNECKKRHANNQKLPNNCLIFNDKMR